MESSEFMRCARANQRQWRSAASERARDGCADFAMSAEFNTKWPLCRDERDARKNNNEMEGRRMTTTMQKFV